jgi:hypothetical protein
MKLEQACRVVNKDLDDKWQVEEARSEGKSCHSLYSDHPSAIDDAELRKK